MKKILLSATILLLCLTGCGKQLTPQESVSKITEKMSALENFELKLDMQASIKMESVNMDMGMKGTMLLDTENNVSKMDMQVNAFGMNVTMAGYSKTTDKETINYTKDETTKTWVKEIDKKEIPTNITNALDMFKNVKKIEEVKGEKNHYKLTIDAKEIQKLLNNVNDTDDTVQTIKEDVIVDYYFNKDYYLTKISFEATAVSAETGDTTLKITSEFAKFNEVGNIVIPDEVLKAELKK
ncbi:MAG: hypothetical protein RSB71_01305 [Bacilli bacterium]